MQPNLLIILAAAFVPMVMGFIWYNPKVLGTAWMNAAGITEDKMKGANMAVIFGVSFLLSFFLAFAMQFIVIHQWGIVSTLGGDPSLIAPGTEGGMFLEKYAHNFRSFKHGALHGTIAGITIALPILGTNALFERKGFKYIAINVGYWTITLALMGGVICQWS